MAFSLDFLLAGDAVGVFSRSATGGSSENIEALTVTQHRIGIFHRSKETTPTHFMLHIRKNFYAKTLQLEIVLAVLKTPVVPFVSSVHCTLSKQSSALD